MERKKEVAKSKERRKKIHNFMYMYQCFPQDKRKGGGGGFSGCTEYEIVSGGLVHVHTPFIV